MQRNKKGFPVFLQVDEGPDPGAGFEAGAIVSRSRTWAVLRPCHAHRRIGATVGTINTLSW